ncbi:MAG TPA: hypothetical protein VK165_04630 [Azonexus sp.]|nr:hypothetical protein [Azonexus sp.]
MNQASFCNCRRHLLIGLLAAIAPLSVLHAADDNEQWRQDQTIDASPPAMPAERSDTGSTSGTSSSQYERDRTPSSDSPRGAQGPIRSDSIGEQPSEYSRGTPRYPRSDSDTRRDEERRRDERNRAMPENTIPSYPPARTP